MVPALTITELCKTYKSGTVALKKVNLSVQQGEFFALLGPNGAGKSTTIGIIASLVNKTSGEVKIFGHDILENPIMAKRYLGLVPQEVNFNQFEKVMDIVVTQAGYYGIPRKQALVQAELYLRQLGLWEKRDAISRTLSGGMKRRLMIARALVHQPKILILDEPTAGVDIELRRSTWSFLQQINEQGVTIILTTHYLDEAEHLCKGIGIIDKGELLERTTIKALLGRLEQETLVLDIQQVLPTPLPEIEYCSLKKIDEQSLEITFPKKFTLTEILENLSKYGLHVTSMRNKANRLEELFMQLVTQR